MSNFINDLRNRIKSNWKFLLVGIIIFFILILANNIFDYSSYFTEIKYNTVIEGGRTPMLEQNVQVKQNFISQKNNLYKIGIYSLMPGISTDSTVNVKVIDTEDNLLVLDQNVFLTTLEDSTYFDVNIPNQSNSKGREYQIIITGIDGNALNSIQFPYSTNKSEYLTGCYVGEALQENNLLVKVTFNDVMYLKKLVIIWGIIFVCIAIISIYGINKETLKEDIKFLVFATFLGIITSISISIIAKINEHTLINVFKYKIGIVTILLSIILGTTYYFILKEFANKKIKLETLFLIIAIPIGLIYCFANPFGRVPDEITHATRALDISYGHIFAKANENNEAEFFYNKKLENIFSINNKTYEQYIDTIKSETDDEIISYKFSNMALYSPICHLSQATGMLFMRIFGASLIVQLYAGRIANLLVTLLLIYLAIKYIPFKKILVFVIALLPISFQEMASLSSDALTIGITLFYTSYILFLRYDTNKKELNKKDWMILTFSSIVVSMSKIVYLPLCLLLFLIPTEKTKSKKDKLIKVGILFASVTMLNLVWTIYSSRFLIEYNIGVDSKKQVLFILKYPFEYIFIMFRTLFINLQNWWLGLVGHDLGIYGKSTINISYIWVYPLSILLSFLFFTNDNEKNKIDIPTKIIFALVFVAIVVLVFTSLYVQFNPVQNKNIIGIQPRYFIPVLLLIPIICSNKYLIFNGKMENKYILMFIIFINIHALTCIINSFLV